MDETKIELIDIIRIQKWYMDIFYQEDDDYPNYRIIGQKNRHKEELIIKKKEWYEKNKEKILQQQKEYRKNKRGVLSERK